MKNSIQKIKEYFNFTRVERNGILVLCIAISILAIIPLVINYFIPPELSTNQFKDYELKLLDSLNSLPSNKSGLINKQKDTGHPNFTSSKNDFLKQKMHPFLFNPNQLPEKEWLKLGLTKNQARVIKNYEAKGGKFWKKEDLGKIYSISPEMYDILAPYIMIPDEKKDTRPTFSNDNKSKYTTSNYVPKKLMVELNQADSATLVLLRGIGPVFARRIIKFRNILGGFYTIDQLKEVYGFDQEKFDMVVNSVIVDTTLIKKININAATLNEIKKHPYMDYFLAKALIDRRVSKGNYLSVDQVHEISSFPEEKFVKIKHYLCIN